MKARYCYWCGFQLVGVPLPAYRSVRLIDEECDATPWKRPLAARVALALSTSHGTRTTEARFAPRKYG